jgi:hypothetical protein
MEIDVDIKRISNGYVVKSNDSSNSERYYPTLGDIMRAWVIEDLNDRDREIRGSNSEGTVWKFKLKTDL